MSTLLRDLWPDAIQSDDMLTPYDILRQQAEYLQRRTKGLVVGEVVRGETDDRVILGFEVFAPRINLRVRLFDVQHRADFEYPAVVEPPEDDLPAYLQSRRWRPGGVEKTKRVPLPGEPEPTPGKWAGNEWVAASPAEFTDLVGKVLDLPVVKSRVVSLIARSQKAQTPEAQKDAG